MKKTKKQQKKGKSKQQKKKKDKKPQKQQQKGSSKATKQRTLPAACTYKPGDYAAERKKFIAESGLPYKQASQAWNTCDRRNELLSHMPHAELVRRRFVISEKKKPSKK